MTYAGIFIKGRSGSILKKQIPGGTRRAQEERAIQEDQTEEAARRLNMERSLGMLPEELSEVIVLYYF